MPLAGRLVLDLGAGTGVAGRAALAAGARRVVAVDLSEGMLRRGGGGTPGRWPTRSRCRSVTAASTWCWPRSASTTWAASRTGLAEARRVGAAIAASTFAPGWTHPAKDAVDGAVRSFGYRPPAWYAALAPGSRASDPEVLAESAAAAGFTRVQARTMSVPTGLATPAELVVVAAGHGPLAPFLRSLDAAGPGRGAARGRAGRGRRYRRRDRRWPLVVSMVVLTAS